MEQVERPTVGRPCEYTEDMADRICRLLGQGKSLRSVCREEWAPDAATIYSWMRRFPVFLKQYEKAKQESADAMAEDIQEISDDESRDVQRAKLMVDTRKWLMARMKPKKYGESLDLTTGHEKMPTPILGYVSNNNSNKEDHADEETPAGPTGGDKLVEDGVNAPLLDTLSPER